MALPLPVFVSFVSFFLDSSSLLKLAFCFQHACLPLCALSSDPHYSWKTVTVSAVSEDVFDKMLGQFPAVFLVTRLVILCKNRIFS